MGKHSRAETLTPDGQEITPTGRHAATAGHAAVGGAVEASSVYKEAPRHTNIPEHARRTDVVDMIVTRAVQTPTTHFNLGGKKQTQGGEMVQRHPIREFHVDPTRRGPLVSRDMMRQQLGIDAALAVTVVLDPHTKGEPVRMHVLDRGPAETTGWQQKRGDALTSHPGYLPEGGNAPGARYVAVTDGFFEGMYQVQRNRIITQPPEGDSWRSIPAEGLTLGRETWRTTFDEFIPRNNDTESISRRNTTLIPLAADGSEQLRIVDQSTNGTQVIVGPLYAGETDVPRQFLQPMPAAENVPYPTAPSYQ